MADDEQKTAAQRAGEVFRAAAPAAATAMVGPTGGTLAKLGDGWLQELAARHWRQNARAFEAEVQRHLSENPETLALVVRDDEKTRRALLTLYQRAVDAIDDAAIPLLAHLMGVYAVREPDVTFRAVARLLQDCGPEQLDHLASRLVPLGERHYPIDGTHVLLAWDQDGLTNLRPRNALMHVLSEWTPLSAWMRSALGAAGLGVPLEGRDSQPQLRLELPALHVLVLVLRHHPIDVGQDDEAGA